MTGDELRYLREHWGLTQIQLADLLGVTEHQVAHWENDRKIITQRVVKQLVSEGKLRAIKKILDTSSQPQKVLDFLANQH